MKRITQIGLLFFAAYCILSRFTEMPDFLQGIMLGTSICFLLVSLIPEKVYNRIINFKVKIKNDITGRTGNKDTQ